MSHHHPISSRVTRTLAFAVLAATLFLASASSTLAQDTMQMRLDYWIQVQDSCWMYRITPKGDTLDPTWPSALFHYEMLYDSTCIVTYDFAECKRNGVRLRLPQWKNRRIVNTDAALLSFNSRTDNFPLIAGDTLSFYREFSWYNPRTYWLDSNTYFAKDSLDFAVELVNASDSLRIDLLDSIGALANSAPGVPPLHGTRPIMALARYVVPSWVTADSGFIRIRLYARGNGGYYFTRHDEVSIGISGRVDDVYSKYLVNRIGQGLGKHVIRTSGGKSLDAAQGKLDVVQSRAAPDVAQIRFSVPDDEGSVAIVIFDARGEAIFYPYAGAAVGAPNPVVYRAPHSGTYFAGLLRNGQIIVTRKFTIIK